MKVTTERTLEVTYSDGGIVLRVKNGELISVMWKPSASASHPAREELTCLFNFLRSHPKDFDELKEKLEQLKKEW